jgi:hypothetical protein
LPEFAWGISFSHPSYSADLAPSDFHLVTHLKQFLGGTRMRSDEAVKKTVKHWFSGLAADFYDAGHAETRHTIQVPESSWGLFKKKSYKVCSRYIHIFF